MGGTNVGRILVLSIAAKIQVATVEKGLFREFIPVTGTVQPIQTVFLDAPEGGTVKQRFVEDGHMVKAGEAIIELNNPQLHMDAINREAQLLDQQNNLRNTRLAMDQQTTRLKDDLLNLDKDLKRLERDQKIDDAAGEGLACWRRTPSSATPRTCTTCARSGSWWRPTCAVIRSSASARWAPSPTTSH
jgi:multidrug efflux pump subunit AcrA (membrane-fusion protein)